MLRGSLLREARADPSDLSLNSPAITQLGADWGAEPIAQVRTGGWRQLHVRATGFPACTGAPWAENPALPGYPVLPDKSQATPCPLSVAPTYTRCTRSPLCRPMIYQHCAARLSSSRRCPPCPRTWGCWRRTSPNCSSRSGPWRWCRWGRAVGWWWDGRRVRRMAFKDCESPCYCIGNVPPHTNPDRPPCSST